MSFSPIPKYAFSEVTEITSVFLKSLGVKFLMLDLDNTIAPYGLKHPPDRIKKWILGLKEGGIEPYIVSNNRNRGRVEIFSKELKIGYIKSARKPAPSGVLRAMADAGYKAEESALAGDQIFTDTLAANAARVVSIILPPLNMKNPLFVLRYVFEVPFRAMCRNKIWRK